MEIYKILDENDLDGEIWRIVPGHYSVMVSNLGRVKVNKKVNIDYTNSISYRMDIVILM